MGLALGLTKSLRLSIFHESGGRRTWPSIAWLSWRGRGRAAFGDRGGQFFRGLPGGRGRIHFRSSSSRGQFCRSWLLANTLLFRTEEGLTKNTCGLTKHFSTCCDGTSRSRRGEQQRVYSQREDIGGYVNKTLQAVRQWSWPSLRRNLSQEEDAAQRRRRRRRRRRSDDDDEGAWSYSPEWWGTQNGGWGHNEGHRVFETPSAMGNGVVSVTAHPASTPRMREDAEQGEWDGGGGGGGGVASNQVVGYEWRVLRFNDVTRQSVAKVKAVATSSGGDIVLLQDPNCIAFEYVKSMIAAGLAAVSLSGLDIQSVYEGMKKMRILCIGLGGGSLPLFLAHNLPGATVEVVEIDGAVITAAVEMMGFPPSYNSNVSSPGPATDQGVALWGDMLQRIIVHERDGNEFVQKRAMEDSVPEYDLVFVDAYDGEDVVPSTLWDRDGPFLKDLSSLLSFDHGTIVVNLHTDSAPPTLLERISGKFGPGFDPLLPQGRRVREAALAYRDVLLRKVDGTFATGADGRGVAFTVAVPFQGNVSLVVSRGAAEAVEYSTVTDKKGKSEQDLIQAFVHEAEKVQEILQTPFDLSKRVSRGFYFVK